MRTFLLKRLPLILFAALGIWFWQGAGGFVPTERTITWRFWGDYARIRKVEVQLWEDDAVLKREEIAFPNGVTFEPTSKLNLKAGSYQAKAWVWREGLAEPDTRSQRLVLENESQVVVTY